MLCNARDCHMIRSDWAGVSPCQETTLRDRVATRRIVYRLLWVEGTNNL